MTSQERLDLEVILRCAAREIMRPYSLHIEDGKLSWEERYNQNYSASERTAEELKNDFLWMLENFHPNGDQIPYAGQIPLIETWLRQFEVWRKI
jgi:hypothetical protein